MVIIVIDKENKDVQRKLLEKFGELSKDLIDYMREFDYYPETNPEQQRKFLSFLLEKGGNVYVFLEGEEVIGFASVYKEKKPNNYFIESIYVIPEKRNQGIGKKLLLAVTKDYSSHYLNLETNVVNHSAIRFYKKAGFEENRINLQKKPEDKKGVK